MRCSRHGAGRRGCEPRLRRQPQGRELLGQEKVGQGRPRHLERRFAEASPQRPPPRRQVRMLIAMRMLIATLLVLWTATEPTASSCNGTAIGTFSSCAGCGVASIVSTGDGVGDDAAEGRTFQNSRQTSSLCRRRGVSAALLARAQAESANAPPARLGEYERAREDQQKRQRVESEAARGLQAPVRKFHTTRCTHARLTPRNPTQVGLVPRDERAAGEHEGRANVLGR